MGKVAVEKTEYEHRGAASSRAFRANRIAVAVAYSVCRGITRSAAKNFYYAFLVLPRAKRQALCAVYAFMRRCDDIADDAALPQYRPAAKT